MKTTLMTRKEFVTLTFTLIGVGAASGACSSSSSTNNDAGTGAAGSTGAAGASGAGGTSGASGAGGASGADGGSACSDPLAEAQDPDGLGHVHTLIVPASTLDATTDQTITTGSAGVPAHTHMVVLSSANLATLKGGGTVDVMSTLVNAHSHTYKVGCHTV